jgi:Zn-finger nucleic acid-binding protein
MTDRQGVEIDYCPTCRGIWLDRGELDKIIERSAIFDMGAPSERDQSYREPKPRFDDDDYDKRREGYYKHKRKKSFLGEIFDF